MLIGGLYQVGKGWLLKKNYDYSNEIYLELKLLNKEDFEKMKDKLIINGLVYTLLILLLIILIF